MQKILTTSLLFIILILGALFRFWNLGSNPPHLTPDEASLGYNAYSILNTGRDEYGVTLPAIFKSFGDYKPGAYVYAAVPSVLIFGLNEFSVRFPSALGGVISILLIFLIVRMLLGKELPSILSSLILATSPWHIQLSRGAWEVNLSLTFTLFGIYFFLKSRKQPYWLLLAASFFALTLLTYQGAKLATGIVVILLLLIFSFWRKNKIKINIYSLIIGLIISLPIVMSLFQGKTGRLTVFSVFSYPRPQSVIQDILSEANDKQNGVAYYLYHPESLNFTRGILGRYFNYFSTRFMFFEGDWAHPRHTAPYSGVLLFVDGLFLIFGFYTLVAKKNRYQFDIRIFIVLWLLFAPLPAALSRDQIHAVRSLNMLIPLTIISAMGFETIILIKKVRHIILPIVFVVYLMSFLYFVDAYFIHVPKHNSQYWEYGYKQVVESVTPIQKNYKKIVVQQSYAQPYIYFLFYQKYDPATYQKDARLRDSASGDVGQVDSLGSICFCAIDWSANRGDKGVLFVADPLRIPPQDSKDGSEFRLIGEIKYLNSADTAFRIIEIKE